MNMVRYKKNEIPPATEEEIANMRAFAEDPDRVIDLSDIPEADDIFFKVAVPHARVVAARKAGPEAVKALTAEIKAHRARLEAERDAKTARATIDAEKPVAVHG